MVIVPAVLMVAALLWSWTAWHLLPGPAQTHAREASERDAIVFWATEIPLATCSLLLFAYLLAHSAILATNRDWWLIAVLWLWGLAAFAGILIGSILFARFKIFP